MKLSVWSSYYIKLSPEDALRELKAHGYDFCELSDEHAKVLADRGDAWRIGTEFKKFADELGTEISQGHLFLGARITIPEDREFIKKELDLFRAIGIKNAVLHCDNFKKAETVPSIEIMRKKNVEALRDLLDYIKDTDLVICLENTRSNNLSATAADLMYFINEFNTKNLAICLDTGHLNLIENPDQLEFIRTCGEHIKALHIADNDAMGIDMHLMPYGRGVIDFIPIIRELKKLGYEGLYNLEIPGERIAPMEILGYKLDYIKKMFEYFDRVTDVD